MKKFIYIFGIIFIFNLNATKTSAGSSVFHGQKAQKIYEEMIKYRDSLGDLSRDCEDYGRSQWLKVQLRMDLDYTNFILSAEDFQRNKCLLSDVIYLEDIFMELVKQAPAATKLCDGTFYAPVVLDEIKSFRAQINCLRRYGEKEKSEVIKGQKCSDTNIDAIDFAEGYNDTNCKGNWSEVYKKITESWHKLESKLGEMDTPTKEMLFETDKDEKEKINNKATENANEWLNKNISSSLSGERFKFGINWSGKTKKQTSKGIISNLASGAASVAKWFLEAGESIVEAVNIAIQGTEEVYKGTNNLLDTASIKKWWLNLPDEIWNLFATNENTNDQINFTLKLVEDKILSQINQEMDQELFAGTGKTGGIKDALNDLMDHMDKTSGLDDELDNKSKTNDKIDSLWNKKKGLKALLDKQDSQ